MAHVREQVLFALAELRRNAAHLSLPFGCCSDLVIVDHVTTSKALTAYELAEILSVSAISIFRLAKRGMIPAFRVGTSLRFCPAAIAEWLRERGG